jgi:hypothetical protein
VSLPEGRPMRGGQNWCTMIKRLHRYNPHTLTRCDVMLVTAPWDWNVFKQIFADHWDEFTQAHPRDQTSYYDGLVAKMLGCGNPAKMDYGAYRCLQGGQGTHLVSMCCKTSLCLRCATVSVDHWGKSSTGLILRGSNSAAASTNSNRSAGS